MVQRNQIFMMCYFLRNNENILITLEGTIYLKRKKETFDMAISISKSKTKYRKKLIDQLGINGRQADMIIDAEAWKQKESLLIAQIPVTDFNRIRKTVLLNNEYARKIIMADITETQKEQAIQFFIQNQL